MFILYSLSTKRFVPLPKHGCKGTYYYLNEQGKQGLFIVFAVFVLIRRRLQGLIMNG
jgi:hypothetical protein